MIKITLLHKVIIIITLSDRNNIKWFVLNQVSVVILSDYH